MSRKKTFGSVYSQQSGNKKIKAHKKLINSLKRSKGWLKKKSACICLVAKTTQASKSLQIRSSENCTVSKDGIPS